MEPDEIYLVGFEDGWKAAMKHLAQDHEITIAGMGEPQEQELVPARDERNEK